MINLPKTNLPSKISKNVIEPEIEPGTLETDCQEEISETLRLIKDRDKAFQKKFQETTDTEFWICLAFPNREIKNEFLRKSGLIELGDKYLHGLKAAKKLNIPMDAHEIKEPKFRIKKRLLDFLP